MFWLESDSVKALHGPAWFTYDKLVLSSIVNHGSMKVDFLSSMDHKKVTRGPLDAL